MSLETELQKTLREVHKNQGRGADEILKRMKIIGVEVPLVSPIEIITQGTGLTLPERNSKTNIGRIDVIFRYKQRNYIAEIKDYEPKNKSFWYATKSVAYCEYYKWQTEDTNYNPAVIIPISSLRLEHQIVAGRMGLSIFVFQKIQGQFKLKLVDDEPHWKQNLRTI